VTVTLSDFTWAVRPTVSDLELTDGGDIVASSGWTAGVGGWAAWDTTAALEALTDEYTIAVVLDPNQASSAWRGLLSVPAYASGAHADPYHVMLLAAAGLGDPTRLVYHHTIANVGAAYYSAIGAIDTSTDGQTCYAVRRSGTNVDYLVDGVEVSSSTVAAGALDWTPHGPVCLGTRSASDPGEGCAGTYVFAGVADRALTDEELVAITSDPLSFEGTPQTWDGSAGTLTITGNSGTFTPGARTWTGSTGTVTVSGVSGSFVPGASIWTGSTGTLTVAGVSGLFDSTWVGSTGTITVSGVSGAFTPGAKTWTGSTGTLTVAGVSGSFTPGARTWSGSTGTLLVSGVSGVFGSGTIWAGSSGSITVTGVSGAFLPGTAVWAGSSGAMAVSGTSSSFTPGDVEWLGSVGVIAVAGVSGSFSTQASLPTTEARTLVAVTAARTMVSTTEARTR
jgi:hypothetical protein